MFTLNGVCTITNVVITNSIQTYLIVHVAIFQGVLATLWPKQKTSCTTIGTVKNMFLTLAIEIYAYLHQQDFFHWHANMV
jgi:hypothetical protein